MQKIKFGKNNTVLNRSVGSASLVDVVGPLPFAIEKSKIINSDNSGAYSYGELGSISGDGNTLIVGSSSEDSVALNSGAIYVYTKSGETWTEQQKIKISDVQSGDNLGRDEIRISNDGNTIIAGVKSKSSGRGAAYVFTRSGETWTEQQKLTPTVQGGDFAGCSVSISGDGNTAIIGAYGYDFDANANLYSTGSAHIYTRTANVWTLQQSLNPPTPQFNARFGQKVSINDDGNTIMVGAPQEEKNSQPNYGKVYVYTLIDSAWVHEQTLEASDGHQHSYFGDEISISSDGTSAVICAWSSDTNVINSGAIYIFNKIDGLWVEQEAIYIAEAEQGDYFGRQLAMSGDGNTVIASSVIDNNYNGIVYRFTRGPSWTRNNDILPSDIVSGGITSIRFGTAIDVNYDGSVIMGSSGVGDSNANTQGYVYIFE